MPSFSLDDLQSDTEFPRLSDEEEDMLVQVRHRLFFLDSHSIIPGHDRELR
jgi:hypothetical protein